MKQDKYEFNNTFWKHSAAELPRNFIWTKEKKKKKIQSTVFFFFFFKIWNTLACTDDTLHMPCIILLV